MRTMATKAGFDLNQTKRGGKRAGAGRPKGGADLNRRDFLERVRQASPGLVAYVVKLIEDESTDASTKLRAIELLWNRAYGRPRTETDEAPMPTTLPGELIDALRKEE